jgi:hypothetical protein
MSRYEPSLFINRAMTVGALRKTESCDANVYRSTSVTVRQLAAHPQCGEKD